MLEITDYLREEGNPLGWSETVLDICSTQSDVATNVGLENPQTPRRTKGSSSRPIVATWLKTQVRHFSPHTGEGCTWREQQTEITFLELLLWFPSCPWLVIDPSYSPPAHSWYVSFQLASLLLAPRHLLCGTRDFWEKQCHLIQTGGKGKNLNSLCASLWVESVSLCGWEFQPTCMGALRELMVMF